MENSRWSLVWLRKRFPILIGPFCSRSGFKIPWTPPLVAPSPVLTCNWLDSQGGGTQRKSGPVKRAERRSGAISWVESLLDSWCCRITL